MREKYLKRRFIYLAMAVFCFGACVAIVMLFSDNSFIRGFTGDIIITGLMCFFAKVFYDFKPLRLAISVLTLAFAVELLQYLKLISLFQFEQNTLARLILGAVFDPLDLIAYTIGAIVVFIFDAKLLKSIK